MNLEEQEIKKEIDSLSHYEMCRLTCFAPIGHKYFDITKPYYKFFKKRFRELGGFTPEISKDLGWK